jgi:flagellar biosynthesis/type III secretory pathway chaperone
VSPCEYTETDAAILKRRHEDLEVLYEMLKTLPEQEANELLVRIRTGAELSEVVEQAKGGTLLVQLSLARGEKAGRKVSITDILNT